MFQLAYFQMVGAGKARNQDALFDGTAVRQVRLHKTRVSEADDAVRLAVADGVSSSMPIDNPTKAACHVHLINSALTKPPIAPHRYLSRRLNLNVCSAKPSSISQVAKSETNAKNEPIIRRQGVSTRPRTLSRIIFPSNNSPRIMEPASNIT